MSEFGPVLLLAVLLGHFELLCEFGQALELDRVPRTLFILGGLFIEVTRIEIDDSREASHLLSEVSLVDHA